MIQYIVAPLFPLDYIKPKELIILEDVIEDRGSRYSVSVFPLSAMSDISRLLELCDPSATHNSYARRILQADTRIRQECNDDGETWAGQIILKELERHQVVNVLLVVTRYFGGVKLETDRYKHVVDACRMVLEILK